MTQEEAAKLCAELVKLIGPGPGACPTSLARVEAITQKFCSVAAQSTYINEKSKTVLHDFKIWLSPRKWQQYGADKAKSTLHTSIYKLQGGYESFGLGGTHPQITK